MTTGIINLGKVSYIFLWAMGLYFFMEFFLSLQSVELGVDFGSFGQVIEVMTGYYNGVFSLYGASFFFNEDILQSLVYLCFGFLGCFSLYKLKERPRLIIIWHALFSLLFLNFSNFYFTQEGGVEIVGGLVSSLEFLVLLIILVFVGFTHFYLRKGILFDAASL